MQGTRLGLAAMLGSLIDTGGALDPAAVWVQPFSAIEDLGVDTTITNLTLPADADYPRQPLTAYGTPYSLADGSPVVDADLQHWTPPDDDHPLVIIGYALFDALTAGNLIGYTMLDEAVALNTTSDVWSIVPRVKLPQTASYDQSVTYDG